MSERIPYPERWPQGARDALDAMFAEARAKRLWFFHGGMSGPLWFSPDELEAKQKNKRFIWSAENWKLRDPAEYVASLDHKIASLQNERADVLGRIAES